MDENLFVAFARFEETQKEASSDRTFSFGPLAGTAVVLTLCSGPQFERVRVIYKYALDRIPKHQAQELFKNYTMFEKKFGDRRGIEDVIVSKRRFQYEEEVKVGERRRSFLRPWAPHANHSSSMLQRRPTLTTTTPGSTTSA